MHVAHISGIYAYMHICTYNTCHRLDYPTVILHFNYHFIIITDKYMLSYILMHIFSSLLLSLTTFSLLLSFLLPLPLPSLGIRESASVDRIKEAYRKLLPINHPDRGGSAYLSVKINEAKDFLLKGK